MPHPPIARVLLSLAAAVLAVHLAHDLTGFGSAAFDQAFGDWFQPAAYAACGLVTLLRARHVPAERTPWRLVGVGMLTYAAGSVVYNLVVADVPAARFPSAADALWLAFYPLAFAGLAMLLRIRHRGTVAGVWLDGLLGGAVVAAVVAVVAFQPVFEGTSPAGVAAVARLAYPIADLVALGFVVVVWAFGGRPTDAFWGLLAAGFAMLATGDGTYVVGVTDSSWSPGGLVDLPYAVGMGCIAAAAWVQPRPWTVPGAGVQARAVFPIVFAVAGVGLASYAVVEGLNPLASALALVTLLAVVARFGWTLVWLARRSADLSTRASTDPLTGLANHRTFHERLREELDRARRTGAPLAVVALDLDHFKAINDTYGHAEGDAALQGVGRTLARQARPYDLVARLGGEEFAFILPGADGATAMEVAERARSGLGGVEVQGRPLSCSAGVASYPEDAPDGGRLLELADGALYWAKRAGRAQVRRYDPREVQVVSHVEQQQEVRVLLEAGDRISTVFQPIVELETGRVGGYEALTRFAAGDSGRSPDLWFAQARRTGLGPALEARAIELALRAPGRPAGAFLAFNVSPAALLAPEVDRVLPGDLSGLVIELTEDDLFSTDAALDRKVEVLRGRGARIAVDDAGAGYAGLQQVVRIKPDILKLDRSLISGIHADASKTALLEAMARFATTTGAAVCGEGVETLDELRVLRGHDITYGQGFVLGRPGPPWATVDPRAADEVTSEVRWGMRLVSTSVWDGVLGSGTILEELARVRTNADLQRALGRFERFINADEIAVSRVLADEGVVETITAHDWGPARERFALEDVPTTGWVVQTQTAGQVVVGDPAADPAELEVLHRAGYGAVLLAPIVFRGETTGLLELYRRAPRPFVHTEIQQARMLAHHLGATLADPAVVEPV